MWTVEEDSIISCHLTWGKGRPLDTFVVVVKWQQDINHRHYMAALNPVAFVILFLLL